MGAGVGDIVGAGVSDGVGAGVGDIVGAGVGDLVGASVDDIVGAGVGGGVGGALEGAGISGIVGAGVGDLVGAGVGNLVGAGVGDGVWAGVGDIAGVGVGAAMCVQEVLTAWTYSDMMKRVVSLRVDIGRVIKQVRHPPLARGHHNLFHSGYQEITTWASLTWRWGGRRGFAWYRCWCWGGGREGGRVGVDEDSMQDSQQPRGL